MSITIGIDDAETLQGYSPGNANGNVPVSNGTLNTNCNVQYLGGAGIDTVDHEGPTITAGDFRTALTALSSKMLKGVVSDGATGLPTNGFYWYYEYFKSSATYETVSVTRFGSQNITYVSSTNGGAWSSWAIQWNGSNMGAGSGLVSDSTALQGTSSVLKWKEITGTTASTEGGNISVAHGLTQTSIISIVPGVDINSNGSYIAPGDTGGGSRYSFNSNAGFVAIINDATDSENILSKPFKVLIGYKE